MLSPVDMFHYSFLNSSTVLKIAVILSSVTLSSMLMQQTPVSQGLRGEVLALFQSQIIRLSIQDKHPDIATPWPSPEHQSYSSDVFCSLYIVS